MGLSSNDIILQDLLDAKVDEYNTRSFIENDPIYIPHLFSKKQDIEIIGFWVAILSWGQRKTIINKGMELLNLMDNSPHDFIINHSEVDRKPFLKFKHRTFQSTDTLYFLEFLQTYYRAHESLEDLFINKNSRDNYTLTTGIDNFRDSFFDLPNAPQRTKKHVSSPANNSSCKRINMFLRWMVRSDSSNVDFGLWTNIKPSQLLIPLDVHVLRVARYLGLLDNSDKANWKSVLKLTNKLKKFDSHDPVKYDYALFNMGLNNFLPPK